MITGFTRSFAQRISNGDILNSDLPNGERREYLKPIMFSGGVGQLDDRHLHKAQKYAAITFTVSKLLGLTDNDVDSSGFVDMAVVNGNKPLRLYGMQLKTGDYIKFINDGEDCDSDPGFGRRLPDAVISPEADSSASVVTCPANSNKCESTLRFTKESRENVHACYWFSRDPGYWKSYENLRLKVMQPGELTVESLEGFSNRGLVANQAKVFHISGNGATYGDKVYLVQSASACLEENALDGRVFQTTVLDGATGFAIVVSMTYATAAEDLKMCYQFSTLTAAGDKVEGVFHVYAVSGFDAERTVGSIDSVVAGKTKELFLLGAGFAESDMVAWAESGASCAERSQEGAMHKLVDVEAFYAVVSMNTLSAGKEFQLCYKFTNEAWNEYPALALRVKHFAGVNGVSQGNANAFVVSQPKSNPACAEQEQEGLKKRHKPAWKLTYEPRATPAEWLASASKYRVAIIREEGSNGEYEVAVRVAGFEPWDVHVRDLLSGRITLEGFRGIVLVGGFSDADVLESVRGWRIKRTAAFSHSMIP